MINILWISLQTCFTVIVYEILLKNLAYGNVAALKVLLLQLHGIVCNILYIFSACVYNTNNVNKIQVELKLFYWPLSVGPKSFLSSSVCF